MCSGGKELKGASTLLPTAQRPKVVPLISVPFCPQQLALSAGNSSSEMEGKPGLMCMLTKPFPLKPLQRMGRNWIKSRCRMKLSWGESASWLTPWLTKLAGLRNSPIVTQRPIEVYSRARVTQCSESRAGTSIPRAGLVGSEPLPSMMSGGRWGIGGQCGQ